MVFKYWLLDTQHKINAEKENIRSYIMTNYDEKYRSVLAKMCRYCNLIQKQEEAEEKTVDFTLDEDILYTNILPYFLQNGLNVLGMHVDPMTSEMEKEFSNLFPNSIYEYNPRPSQLS